MKQRYAPGGDAQALAEIARRAFGGYLEMFEHHGWPERGTDIDAQGPDPRRGNLRKRAQLRRCAQGERHRRKTLMGISSAALRERLARW